MSTHAVSSGAPAPAQTGSRQLRVAFVGTQRWLDGCAPSLAANGIGPQRFALSMGMDLDRVAAELRRAHVDVTVLFDPSRLSPEFLRELPGTTLGLHPRAEVDAPLAAVAGSLDRLISFFPSMTGLPAGETTLWRALPPPVSDAVYGDVRRPRTGMKAMTVGRASDHRERMLLKAKHHHDLLQVVHGLSGESLIELLREYDVGVYVSPWPGGTYGAQIGMHLAAGQLLLAEAPTPAHGLERNIDYLHFDSADGLTWTLDRLQRFPEMYHRIRVRGRLKAEQYRASRVFARIAHDLLADVRAFGSARSS